MRNKNKSRLEVAEEFFKKQKEETLERARNLGRMKVNLQADLERAKHIVPPSSTGKKQKKSGS